MLLRCLFSKNWPMESVECQSRSNPIFWYSLKICYLDSYRHAEDLGQKNKLKANTDFKTHCKAAFLHARLQQYVHYELPDVQAGFRKARGTTDQITNICWIIKITPEKHLLLLYWLCQSLWLCGSQQTVENFSRDGNTRPPDLPPEKSVCRSRSNS